MSVFSLKLIAIVTMVIDHIGLYFFPNIILFRIVGRISFPLFCWLIANGAVHTKNIKKYLVRLLLLAIASQPFFYLANSTSYNVSPFKLNVVFTLFIGLFVVFCLKNLKNIFLRFGIILFFAQISNLINSEYGAMGVFSMAFFYLFYKNTVYMLVFQVLIYSTSVFWQIFPYINQINFLDINDYKYFVQMFCLAALFLIAGHNWVKGREVKYFFYIFYPLQYFVIYIIQLYLSR